jgi:hypothetical protein
LKEEEERLIKLAQQRIFWIEIDLALSKQLLTQQVLQTQHYL